MDCSQHLQQQQQRHILALVGQLTVVPQLLLDLDKVRTPNNADLHKLRKEQGTVQPTSTLSKALRCGAPKRTFGC